MMRNRGQRGTFGGAAGRGAGRGRGAGQSAAQLLLQKASTQLRGERVPIKPREEDELASYLNSLTQKTSQQAKSVNYEEFGDISISSGADAMTPRVRRTPSPAIGAGSKFLKKKAQPSNDAANSASAAKKPGGGASGGGSYGVKPAGISTALPGDDEDDDDDDDENFADTGVKAAKSVGISERSGATAKVGMMPAPSSAKKGGFQVSSALNKATALANKITQRSSGSASLRRTRGSLLDSDTDESIGPVLHGSKRGGKGSRPGSASDNSIGHDGNKFIKKRRGASEVKAEGDGKGAGKQSPVRTASKERSRTKSPDRHRRGNSSMVRASSNVYLTSEEESLAEFIQGLSGSDESRVSQRRAKQAMAKAKRQASQSPSPSPSPNRRSRHRSPSPAQSPKVRGRSAFHRESARPVFHRPSSQESDSVISEVADSRHEKIMIADSISLNEALEINLMDADTLGPIILVTPEPASYSERTKRSAKKHVSPFKKSRTPSPSVKKKSKDKGRKASKKKKDKSSSIFESFGVHSVEDLLGAASDKENTDESEITTEPVEARKRRKDHSVSQIVTEIQSRGSLQRQVSYTDDFEASISERIGEDKGKSHVVRKVSVSSIPTQYSDEETGVDYTEDFASETLSMAKDSDSDRSSHYRYSDEEAEATETLSGTAKPAQGEKKVVVESRSVEIQTAAPAGLNYQWFSQTGISVLGPSHGLGSVDPTPIAATVISADALETMTAYSPATLAIHDMLKQQIELIKQFAQAHDRLYHALSDSNVPDYKYTTLEGTKAFIRKHRKPRLTMKQALKMVSEEMDR